MGKLVDQGFFLAFSSHGQGVLWGGMSGMVYYVRSLCQLRRGLGLLWGFSSLKAIEQFGYTPCERTMRRK